MSSKSFVFAIALGLFATSVSAHEFKAGALTIDHPWTRATPKGASVAAGYMKITNSGGTADRLTAAGVDFANKAEIHEMSMDNGVMRMRPVEGGIEIKPGQTVELKPGGFHLMFMNLAQPLKSGDKVKGVLTFEKAGKVDVEYAVEGVGGGASDSHTNHMKH